MKKVFNAVEVMEFGRILDARFTAKYAVGCAIGDNVGYAIDAAWNWFHTGFVNNFISTETHLLHLNWK